MKDDKKRYLIIDFNGVLITENYLKRLVEKGVDTSDKYGPLFDPKTVKSLRKIIRRLGCEIVVSSSWRKMGLEKLRKMWVDRDMPGSVHSVTPNLNIECQDLVNGGLITIPAIIQKTLEIDVWIQNNTSGCNCFIVSNNCAYIEGPLVMAINSQKGLGYSVVTEAELYFTGWHSDKKYWLRNHK